MTYASAEALRMALEQRLQNRSRSSGVGLDRLRRRVVFERLVSRPQVAEPGKWVLKGGMALEVRLQDGARLTKDVDLGLRDPIGEHTELRDRLIEALVEDPFDDRFAFAPGPVDRLMADAAGHLTWRTKVIARLAGKQFGTVQLDVSPRSHELEHTDLVLLPNTLDFAGIETSTIEIIDIHRHAAEKFHGMLRQFSDRENTRVRDLADIVILAEHGMIRPELLGEAAREVWLERDGIEPPALLPPLPSVWHERYEKVATEQDLSAGSFAAGVAVASSLWADALSDRNA